MKTKRTYIKLLGVVSSILMLSLLSCSADVEKRVYFVNTSSKVVTYSMYQGSYLLNPTDLMSHWVPIELDVAPSFSVAMPMNVVMKKEAHVKEDRYIFTDVTAIPLHILNTLPISIKISTGQVEYMDTAFIIVSPSMEDTSHCIYTKNPKFIIEDSEGYPADIQFNYDANTVYVVIR
jgi:hypothetical protein